VSESRLAPLPFAQISPATGIPGQVRVTRFPAPTSRTVHRLAGVIRAELERIRQQAREDKS